jgi:hypothetical protein
MGQHLAQRQPPEPAFLAALGLAFGNGRPRGFKEQPILHTGRTSRFTSTAAQTEVNMFLKRAAGVNAPVGSSVHQLDTPTWAVHFGVKNGVGWASGQTKPTMHTLVEQFRKFW